MKNEKAWMLVFIFVVTLLLNTIPTKEFHMVSGSEDEILDEMNALITVSQRMVESAVEAVSKGLSEMTSEEKEHFESIFDPSDSGTIDQIYLDEVLANFIQIHRLLDKPLLVEYKANREMCVGIRVYYTDFSKIYVCPYFNLGKSTDRNARLLVKEVAYMTLFAGNQFFYSPNTYSASSNSLASRGSWNAREPVYIPIFREISPSDTLIHPDSYAWYASLTFSWQK
jgi:hypothetical protein